jgi:Protein of unknown function (DUF3179)
VNGYAWPLKLLGERPELRHATVGGTKTVIRWDGRTPTAAAHAPETEGDKTESVTLAVDASNLDSPWVDKETNSRWSIVGRAVSGPRKGQTLRWLPGVMVKWYAWAAEYPKTLLESHQGQAVKTTATVLLGTGSISPTKSISRPHRVILNLSTPSSVRHSDLFGER